MKFVTAASLTGAVATIAVVAVVVVVAVEGLVVAVFAPAILILQSPYPEPVSSIHNICMQYLVS